jgi:hypothetical protein
MFSFIKFDKILPSRTFTRHEWDITDVFLNLSLEGSIVNAPSYYNSDQLFKSNLTFSVVCVFNLHFEKSVFFRRVVHSQSILQRQYIFLGKNIQNFTPFKPLKAKCIIFFEQTETNSLSYFIFHKIGFLFLFF